MFVDFPERFESLLAIDKETLEDVKEMEEVFDEVRDDPLYQHLLATANVRSADVFGLNVPGEAYGRMAVSWDDSWKEMEKKDWFRTARLLSCGRCVSDRRSFRRDQLSAQSKNLIFDQLIYRDGSCVRLECRKRQQPGLDGFLPTRVRTERLTMIRTTIPRLTHQLSRTVSA